MGQNGLTLRGDGDRVGRARRSGTARTEGGERQIQVGNVSERASPGSLSFAFVINLVVGHGEVESHRIH